MITESFDTSQPIITPAHFYSKGKFFDICILTYKKAVEQFFLKTFCDSARKVCKFTSANGSSPVYAFDCAGKTYGFYLSPITSALSATVMTEVSYMTGATKFIAFGSAGSLDKEKTEGKIIIPTQAYRDEGFSYHYATASDFITIKNALYIEEFCKKKQLSYVMGKTWTTDAMFMETKDKVKKRKEQGCISVEMEISAQQSLCDFYNLEYYVFIFSSDNVDESIYDRKILGSLKEVDVQLKYFYIALDLAQDLK